MFVFFNIFKKVHLFLHLPLEFSYLPKNLVFVKFSCLYKVFILFCLFLMLFPSIFSNETKINRSFPVGVEHLITLLTPKCFQTPLTPRMFPVWDFVVGIFARKALLNMRRVLSTFSCKYLYK